MKRLFTSSRSRAAFRAMSAPETPGSIHEGGELGYAISHAYGAAFDGAGRQRVSRGDLQRGLSQHLAGRRRLRPAPDCNPDLIVACVIGDGEAETGPLATSWHSNKFLNPVTDGTVLPILHLNGYKIS